MFGQANIQEGTEGSAASQSNNVGGANLAQECSSSSDSGATNHMTSSSAMLDYKQHLPPDRPRRVYLPNGYTTRKVSRGKHTQCFTAEANKETQTQSDSSQVLLCHQRLDIDSDPSTLAPTMVEPVVPAFSPSPSGVPASEQR
ncbi:hypothetical protein H5410_043995 [Solanum commersonii]|uniref:Uncharacterized protein n=1 Tax=Solanum commersonii TaxID=4109 RepID=A0A9J5XZ59_SOLCO|nr:hypothetical protein H5410_043995 [Solanum commersonii]